MEPLTIGGNLPGGISINSEACRLLNELDTIVLASLNEPTPMNFRFTVVPQPYYSARVLKFPELEEKVLESVPVEVIEGLFDAMVEEAAWLSANYEIGRNKQRKCFFNYQERFNRYEPKWKYNSSFVEISPKRGAFIRFFDNHPRELEPKWVSGLRWEEAELQRFLEEADSREVFSEALERRLGSESSILKVVSEVYEEKLLNRDLLPFFVDSELSSKQGKALASLVERPTVEEVLESAYDYWSFEELLGLGSEPFMRDCDVTDYSDVGVDELDEMLEEYFKCFVRMQTINRFPDLGF